MDIKIFTEDTRGPKFFSDLHKILKSKNIIDNSTKIDVEPIPGSTPCNSKQTRVLNAASDYNRIIIIFDADGPENMNQRMEKMNSHISRDVNPIVNLVICEYEIEEWVCKSLNINYGIKPSEDLDNYCRAHNNRNGYKKSDLFRFASKIDIERLMQIENYSFRRYVELLS